MCRPGADTQVRPYATITLNAELAELAVQIGTDFRTGKA